MMRSELFGRPARSAAAIGAVPGAAVRAADDVEDVEDDAVGRGPSAVDAAIHFVATQPGGARRILLAHDRRHDGTCGGCLTSPVAWPCLVSVIALRARELDVAS